MRMKCVEHIDGDHKDKFERESLQVPLDLRARAQVFPRLRLRYLHRHHDVNHLKLVEPHLQQLQANYDERLH